MTDPRAKQEGAAGPWGPGRFAEDVVTSMGAGRPLPGTPGGSGTELLCFLPASRWGRARPSPPAKPAPRRLSGCARLCAPDNADERTHLPLDPDPAVCGLDHAHVVSSITWEAEAMVGVGARKLHCPGLPPTDAARRRRSEVGQDSPVSSVTPVSLKLRGL